MRKCYCTATLRPDGTCKHGCDPALRRPGMRRRGVEAKEKARDFEAGRRLLGVRETRAGLAKALPARLLNNGGDSFGSINGLGGSR